ncbi:SEC14-like protein 2 [Seminavis robusta]|uniref:SEC14-like protein 2 n=1 Tax=Seminavis robusta TaxID=568900 RepID=A0A9N8DPM6_9STRA|nr:SEC14-like protein 2 [Seminavis robusta]|eukprot:Sro171_g075720.1 SEC14-like protein 2 (398) ;mRNA; f:27328-28666
MNPYARQMMSPDRDAQGKIVLRTYSKDPWGAENVQEYIDSWGLTQEQIDKMWALQRKLVDVDHFKNEPECILRFMFAPTGYDNAEACFRKMIEWRLDNNVDTILDDYNPPKRLLESSSSAMLHGLDREGDPIYVERGGAVDVGTLLKEFSAEEIVKFCIWTRELHTRGAWIEAFERRQGRRIKGVTVVYDLKGMSTKHLNPKGMDLFGEIMKFSNACYPGPIKRLIIIRAPSIFRYAWAVAKNFFRQSLRRKMIFASKNYLDVLDEFIPREVLPPSIAEGGLGRVAMGMPPLIGDVKHGEPNSREALFNESVMTVDSPFQGRTGTSRTGRGGKAVYSPFEESSRASLAETDDGSASSDELTWGAPSSLCSVAGSGLLRGVWVDQDDGSSEIFTRAVA